MHMMLTWRWSEERAIELLAHDDALARIRVGRC
jgi:hypothetical protein